MNGGLETPRAPRFDGAVLVGLGDFGADWHRNPRSIRGRVIGQLGRSVFLISVVDKGGRSQFAKRRRDSRVFEPIRQSTQSGVNGAGAAPASIPASGRVDLGNGRSIPHRCKRFMAQIDSRSDGSGGGRFVSVCHYQDPKSGHSLWADQCLCKSNPSYSIGHLESIQECDKSA